MFKQKGLENKEAKPKPITSKAKTNRDLLAQVFPRFHVIASSLIGQWIALRPL